MKFTPRPIQKPAIDMMRSLDRCAIWAGMGTGKTSAVLSHLDACYGIFGETRPTLVLGPKRVAASVWKEDLAKWHMPALDVSVCVGNEQERVRALRRDSPIVSMNYENLPWLVEHLDGKWPFGRVVADEATRLKSFRLRQGGARTAALARFAHTQTKSFIELTGTPAPNGLKDLWGQAWFIDGGKRLGLSYQSFMDRWFQAVPGTDGYQQVRPLPHAQDEIQAALQDVCITLDPKDYFDIKEPIVVPVPVHLPAQAMGYYRQMEKEFFIAFSSGGEVEVFSAAGKSMKCLQLAAGAIYTDEQGNWKETHKAKLDALDSIIAEANGMPVLVSYQFKSDKARIMAQYKDAVDLSTPKGMATFKAGKAGVGLAHPASLGHGVDGLQHITNIIVFFSMWWDLELHDQVIGRIGPMRQLQAGFERPVYVYYLVAQGTLDEDVLLRYETKSEIQDILTSSMKRRGLNA